MDIVIVGAGRIGSVFAFHLARAGHEVTVVARGARLDALRQEGAIVAVDGRRAPVHLAAELDTDKPFDLAIVTVPEHQIRPLLKPLAASAAKTVLLMFNSFAGIQPYEAVLGAGRVTAGFPNMVAYLERQRLRFKVDGPGMVTSVCRPDLSALFKAAGMPSEVEADMDAFLRSHAALAVPLFVAALWMWQRPQALTWAEARRLADALDEGLVLVRQLGHPLRPRSMAALAAMPRWLTGALMWTFSRSALVRGVGEFGPAETRWLIDAMVAAGPGRTRRLLALRP